MSSSLERLIGKLPNTATDYRDWSDMVSGAIVEAAARDRDRFIDVLTHEPTLLEISTVVFALGAVDDERIIPLVLPALRSRDSLVRWSAAHALAKRRDPRVVDAFIEALGDGAPKVRVVVIEALGNVGTRRALDPLREALARPTNAKDDYLVRLLEAAIKKLSRKR
jgi:HEAT repeat protein